MGQGAQGRKQNVKQQIWQQKGIGLAFEEGARFLCGTPSKNTSLHWFSYYLLWDIESWDIESFAYAKIYINLAPTSVVLHQCNEGGNWPHKKIHFLVLLWIMLQLVSWGLFGSGLSFLRLHAYLHNAEFYYVKSASRSQDIPWICGLSLLL